MMKHTDKTGMSQQALCGKGEQKSYETVKKEITKLKRLSKTVL